MCNHDPFYIHENEYWGGSGCPICQAERVAMPPAGTCPVCGRDLTACGDWLACARERAVMDADARATATDALPRFGVYIASEWAGEELPF